MDKYRGDRMVMELRSGDFVIAHHEVSHYPGSMVHLTGVEGHVELKVNVS